MTNYMRRTSHILMLAMAVGVIACKGKGGGEKTVPTPLGPGEVITVSLCGSTTEPRGPCGESLENTIQIRVGTVNSAVCPCYRFAFLNQNLTDLGSPVNSTYEFTGFRPGNYEVTGEMLSPNVDFTFWHNTSTSTIGVVPSSLRSLTGPARSSNQECRIGYDQGFANPQPVRFSFQFTIAAGRDGGSC